MIEGSKQVRSLLLFHQRGNCTVTSTLLLLIPPFLYLCSVFMFSIMTNTNTSVIELTVISTEGLNNYTSYLNPTIRPSSITLTKFPPTPTTATVSLSRWDDKFRVSLDHSFFTDTYSSSCLYLQLFTKRRFMSPAQIGWCMIPASDFGLLTPGSVRYLSYRLRGRDGCRGHAIINISIRLENTSWLSTSLSPPTMDTCHTVIGIPVTAIRGGDCSSTTTTRIHDK